MKYIYVYEKVTVANSPANIKNSSYVNAYLSEGLGDYTDANDATVLTVGQNLDGSNANNGDYIAASARVLLPFISAKALVDMFQWSSKKFVKGENVLKYANKYGFCREFCKDFTSKYRNSILKEGRTIKTMQIDIGKGAYIGTYSERLSDNGLHQFLEVTNKNGVAKISVNVHPEGMLKDDYGN